MTIVKLSLLIMYLVINSVFVNVNSNRTTSPEIENSRQIKEYSAEQWQFSDNTEFLSNPKLTTTTTKRLRLRRRKKKPPIDQQLSPLSNHNQSFENIHHSVKKTLHQPMTVHQQTSLGVTTTNVNANNLNQLKILLKQENSGRPFSLSEIIQKKKISLSELLVGDTNAVNAVINKLSTTTTTPSTLTHPLMTTKVKFQKFSFIEKESINRKFEQMSSSQEVFVKTDDIGRHPVTGDKQKDISTVKSKLPITNVKLNEMIKKHNQNKIQTKVTSEQPILIDIHDVYGFNDMKKKTEIITMQPENHMPKLIPTSAEEEIAEILKDQNERENLTKILKARNMTIQELIEQRKRGSSKLHLADIFHNDTREPIPQFIHSFGILKSGRQPKSYEIQENNEKKEDNLEIKSTRLRQSITEPLLSAIQNKIQYPPENPTIIQIQSTKNAKSNLIVSSLIVGLSFFVFVAILITFKWIQRNNKWKYNNYSTLSRFYRNKRKNSQKTSFVIETLDNTSINYYKNKNNDDI